MMAPSPGSWSVVQVYRFVTGSYNAGVAGQTVQWDCTSPDWRLHYTTTPEAYCWNDYLAALAQIPPDVTVTDPASVAEAVNPDPVPPQLSVDQGPPVFTRVTTATFSFSSSTPRSWFTCALDDAAAQVCTSPFTVASLTPGAHVLHVVATGADGLSSGPTDWKWKVGAKQPPGTPGG